MVGFNKQVMDMVNNLRPMDDEFFKLLAGIKDVCQEIIRTLLEDDSIEIVSVISQAHISSFARSVVLDNLSTTSDGSYINLDVQKTPINDDIRRTRFHEGAITVTNTPKGTEFKDVPDVTVIFIAEYDVLGSGKMITEIHKHIETDDGIKNISDGNRTLIVNAKIDDGSLKAELLKMFLSKDVVYNKNFPALSKAINHYKNTEEGRGTMSEAMRKLVELYAKDIIEEKNKFQLQSEKFQLQSEKFQLQSEKFQNEKKIIQHEKEIIQHEKEEIQLQRKKKELNHAIIIIKGIESNMNTYHESLEEACSAFGISVDYYNAAKELASNTVL